MSDKPPEEKAAAPEVAPAAGGGGISPGMFFGVIGGMVVILLGGGFALFQYVVMPQINNIRPPAVSEEVVASGAPAAEGHGDKAKAAEHGGAEKPKADAHGAAPAAAEHGSKGSSSAKSVIPFELKEIKVNVANTRAGRILQVSLSFSGPEDVITELKDNESKVTDLVLQILARKTMDELTAPTAYGMIRTEIITNVNAFLTEGKIDGVSFTQFLIQ